MPAPVYIVQGSSRSWSGGVDLCMLPIGEASAMETTLWRVFDHAPDARVIVCAPAFDEGGFDFLKARFEGRDLRIHASHDASPVERMAAALEGVADDALVSRLDGLHFCWDARLNDAMRELAAREALDCVKLPDDYPVHFASEVYRVGALRRAAELLAAPEGAIFRVHPRFWFFTRPDLFRCRYHEDFEVYDDALLARCREATTAIYEAPRQDVNDRRIWSGDQLSFHYELARARLAPGWRVLDIACGGGYGARHIADAVGEVFGGDIDAATIEAARASNPPANVSFHLADVTKLQWADGFFDAVLSMETFEHVAPDAYLRQIARVLKPGGRFILSTPQNRMGHIPVNSCHLREYALDEALALCGRFFEVDEVVGIKGGRIVVAGDPVGSNMMLFCRKR